MTVSHSFSPGLSENMPGVVDVRFAEREPAEKRRLLSWEQVKYPHIDAEPGLVLRLCYSVSFFPLFIEKHLYFARGPAGLLSDNRWVYTNLEH